MKEYKFLNRKGILLSSLLFFFLIVNVSMTSAVPPQTNFGELDVEHAQFDTFTQNKAHNFTYIITNSTSVVQGATCNFNLKYQDGSVLFFNPSITAFRLNEYYVETNADNFSLSGDYSVLVSCNTSAQAGGLSHGFQVTPSGQGGSENTVFFIFLIGIIYFIGFFGFFGKNEWISALGGMGMIALSTYLIRGGIIIYRDYFTNYLAYITLGLGAIFTLIPILEMIKENIDNNG